MCMMLRQVLMFVLLYTFIENLVTCKKQEVSLSDSYLPVTMQIIAHLTDQMAYEVKDDPNMKPTTKPTNTPFKQTNRPLAPNRPTSAANRPTSATNRPTTAPNRPTSAVNKPTSFPSWPTIQNKPTTLWKPTNGWHMTYTTPSIDGTTPFHKPGIYAPLPPKGGDRLLPKEYYVLLPIDHNSQYTVIEPHGQPTSDSLLSPEKHGQVKPIVEPKPNSEPLLPFEETVPVPRTDDGISIDNEEFSDENLQYLAPELRDVIKLANDPTEERAIDIWGDDVNRKAYIQQSQTKGKLSSSNLRLMLLYDLLSREAKRQKLSDYSGFSASVMKELADSAGGGARNQLSFVLSKMLDRKDCQHDYANNRAKEMIVELGKDESTLSAEIRYLQPLFYSL